MEERDIDMEDGEVDDQTENGKKEERGFPTIVPVSFLDIDSTIYSPVPEDDLIALYTSLELPEDEVSEIVKQSTTKAPDWVHRFEAIHLRGTEDMSTNDIFDYFNSHKPASVEWINDFSCNAVWLEATAAARAMLAFSDEIIKNTKKPQTESEEKDTIKDESLPDISIPPGVWRKGKSFAKAKGMLMRFATKNDKKVRGAEKQSRYYQKYGNPNYGGMKGLISNSKKRRLRGDHTVDDKKNPWGNLAEEWGDNEDLEERFLSKQLFPPSLARCLGRQPRPSPSRSGDDTSSGSQSESDESDRHGGKKPRMRMYADDEEKKISRPISKHTTTVDWGDKLNALRQGSDMQVPEDFEYGDGKTDDLRTKLTRRKDTQPIAGASFDLRSKLKNRSMPMDDE